LTGLLYLENNLAAGVFIESRVKILKILAAQAAISLRNAQLYQERSDLLKREQDARIEAEKSVKLREDFITVASHELRSPLTPLKLQIEMIKRYLQSPDKNGLLKARGFLGVLKQSAQQIDRLSILIEDILDASRINAGRLTLNRELTDLAQLVRNVIDKSSMELSRIECVLHLPVDQPVVGYWDPSRIEQVITNLLSNAIKYGLEKPIEITVWSDEQRAKLSVRDHGMGIAKEDQDRIFGYFERAVSFKHFGGFGVGLYITRQIVLAHRGDIYVESAPNKGATFVVELPLSS